MVFDTLKGSFYAKSCAQKRGSYNISENVDFLKRPQLPHICAKNV